MKISELITELQAVQKEHGDLEVILPLYTAIPPQTLSDMADDRDITYVEMGGSVDVCSVRVAHFIDRYKLVLTKDKPSVEEKRARLQRLYDQAKNKDPLRMSIDEEAKYREAQRKAIEKGMEVIE